MNTSISEAIAHLPELVRRAGAGEEIVLTAKRRPVARLVSVAEQPTPDEVRKVIDDIMESTKGKGLPGPDAAHASDFLYDNDGLPW